MSNKFGRRGFIAGLLASPLVKKVKAEKKKEPDWSEVSSTLLELDEGPDDTLPDNYSIEAYGEEEVGKDLDALYSPRSGAGDLTLDGWTIPVTKCSITQRRDAHSFYSVYTAGDPTLVEGPLTWEVEASAESLSQNLRWLFHARKEVRFSFIDPSSKIGVRGPVIVDEIQLTSMDDCWFRLVGVGNLEYFA